MATYNKASLLLVAASLTLSACAAPTPQAQTGTTTTVTEAEPSPTPMDQINAPAQPTGPAVNTPTIEIDGSSTVFPITEAAAKEFKRENAAAEITVEFSGTTGGFRKFCAGETDISNASRPISTEEIEACRQSGIRFLELPVAFDALTVAVNPQNTWAQALTLEELRRIWEPAAQGKITTWDQVRPDFPKQPLKLYGAGLDSGTYDYFAEVVTGGDATRTDYTGSEDDNMLVQGIASDPNALGYFGFSYFEQNTDKLKAVGIDNGQGGGAVIPSRAGVENAEYQPFSRPLFIYVNGQAAQQNTTLRDFVAFYMQNGRQLAESVNYIPLPEEAYEVGTSHMYKGEYGTAYAGKPQPNLTIKEVLAKEQAL